MNRMRARHLLAAAMIGGALVAVGLGAATYDDETICQDYAPPGPPSQITEMGYLVGTWNVAAKFIGPDGTPMESTTTSTITSVLDGCALQESLQYDFAGIPVKTIGMRTFDRVRNVFRVVWFDSFIGLADVFEGTMDSGVLSASNLRAGTCYPAPDGNDHYTRFHMRRQSDDRFTMTWESSIDEGATWKEAGVMTYTRAR